jgi:hypothetical protein
MNKTTRRVNIAFRHCNYEEVWKGNYPSRFMIRSSNVVLVLMTGVVISVVAAAFLDSLGVSGWDQCLSVFLFWTTLLSVYSEHKS